MPKTDSASRPAVVLLHSLGASGDEFAEAIEHLPADVTTLAINLPGFGGESTAPGTSIDAMIDFVVERMRAAGIRRAALVGHSMGGKISTLLASRAMRHEITSLDITSVVLLAASPPSPEPMPDSKREEMLSWVSDGPISETHAREFLDANLGGPLPPARHAAAIRDVCRSSPAAWTAWLTTGSREDRSAEAGEINVPAVIVAGGSDGDLGFDAQKQFNAPHYPEAELVTLEGAGHLLPLERPREVADIIARLAAPG